MTENIFDQHPEDEQAQQNTTSIFDSHPAEGDAAPYAPPGSIEEKQRKVEMGIAELRAKNMETQRAQKAFRISQDEGLPMEVAYRQADKFIQSRKPGEIAAIAPDAPASARYLSKGDNLSVYTPEDVQKLGTWEKLQRQWEKTGRESEEGIELSDLGFKMMNGSATKQDEARYYEIKQLQRSRADFEDDGWVPFIMSAAHSAVDYTVTAAERSAGAAVQGAAGGAAAAAVAGQLGPQAMLPEEIATVPAGAVFGGTFAFGGEMMRQTYQLISGQAFLAAKETLDADGNPLDDETAKAVGITTGLVSALFEIVTLGAASKIVAPTLSRLASRNGVKEFVAKVQQNPALKSSVTKVATNITRQAGAEAMQEVAEQTTQIVSILVGGGKFDEDGNRVDEQLSLENTLLTALGGALGGGFMGAGLQAGAKGADIGITFARNRIQARRDALVAQGDALRGISATKGAPGALADFASELEADSPSQASAPAEALTKLFQDAGLSDNDVAQQFPELKTALDDAAQSGVEVPISHQTMIKLQMLEKEAFDEFSQDVRTDPKLQTAREAAAEGQQDQAALEEEISKMTEEQKVAAVEASLIEEATQQIVAATDQSAATARAQAKLRVRGQITMMRNAGYSIEDIAQLTRVSMAGPNKYAVEVKGQETAGPDAMQQPDVVSTPNFRQWFANSKVVDESGAPLQVYHGTDALDFSAFKIPSFFTEAPKEAGAYSSASTMARRDRALRNPKYNIVKGDAGLFVGQSLPYVGIPEDIPAEAVGQIWVTDNGVVRKNQDGSTDVFSAWEADYNTTATYGENGEMSLGIKPSDGVMAQRLVDEYNASVDRVYPPGEGEGGRVYPVYLSIQNPIELSATEANRLGARLEAMSPDEVEAYIADLEAQGYDGIVTYSDEATAFAEVRDDLGGIPRQYIPFRPSQIKSPFNRGTFDPGSDNILFQTASLRRGTETLKRFGLDPDKRYTTREVATALEARQRQRYGTIERGDYSAAAKRRIADWMVEEVMFEVDLAEVNPERSAVGWYSTKYQRAMDAMGEAFPELVGDMDMSLPGVAALRSPHNARSFFTALMAITSDGAKVADNFRFAAQAYASFRQTGVVDANVTFGGERNSSMRINLQNIQDTLNDVGPDNFATFLLRKDTVSNLKKMAKEQGKEFTVAYKASMQLPYSALVFGPKLGAFYANLMGDTGYLTMDRWWSRTFNRYRGTLLRTPTDEGIARFKELVTADRRLNATAESITDDEAIAMTVDYVASYKAKGYKNGTEIEKAANTIYKAAFEQLEDQPFNASDREFMIDTVVAAQKSLKRKGVDLTVADIQAVLWYYEKRLYGELGARQTQDVSYEEIARRAARSDTAGRSVDELAGDDAGRGETVLNPNAAGQTPGTEGAVDATERLFQTDAALRPDAEAVRRVARGSAPARDGTIEYVAVYGQDRPIYEVTDPEAFRELITAAKADMGAVGAQVFAYDDYSGMRLFVFDGGYAGFALKGDDLVSVFAVPGMADPGAVARLMPVALSQGARRLDAFDTFLPGLYARYGFVETRREPWSDEFQPEGWDAEAMAEFNDGRPDVVYMEATNEAVARASEQAGDGGGRYSSAGYPALEGAPTVAGASGPDLSLVSVAEQYAREAGIDLRRQAEFVEVDVNRAQRIAQAYEQMPHAPQDPIVREAYENLIRQTTDQYLALERAGYQFYFFDPEGADPYADMPGGFGNPWNAMRDLRANKRMAVFPTSDGFGSSDMDVSDNPLLADTGIQWPWGSPDGELRNVTANDLFRAVHDAFGHGLEGAGFRARGEENAWQAHARLFTGSALGALTSETRGQNSWLNFGPHGETNRTAQVEDTVFADQKTGLMPEWTWTEGRAADEVTRLNQDVQPVFYSAMLRGVEGAKQPKAPAAQWMGILKNMPGVKQEELDWLGVEDWLKSQDGSVTKEQLVEYIRANQVNVEEVVLGEGSSSLSREEKLPISERLDELYGQKMIVDDLASEGTVEAMDSPQLLDAVLSFQPNAKVTVEMIVADPTMRDAMQTFVRVSARNKQRELRDEMDQLKAQLAGPSPRHEHHYRLPGGENYREIVLTMPGQIEPYVPDDLHFTSEGGGTAIGWARIDDRTGPNGERILHVDEIQTKRHQDALKKGYQPKPRMVTRYRVKNTKSGFPGGTFDTRAEAENAIATEYAGLGSLVVEEVRQDAREVELLKARDAAKNKLQEYIYELTLRFNRSRGQTTDERAVQAQTRISASSPYEMLQELGESKDELTRLYMDRSGTQDAYDAYRTRQARTGAGVPDAPFKTTWDELVLKRVLRYAIDNGYDSITWPSGEIVADRYDWRKKVDVITWDVRDQVPGKYVGFNTEVTLRMSDGSRRSLIVDPDGEVVESGDLPQSVGLPLSDIVGKQAADKIMDEEGEGKGRLVPSQDISIGGDFLLNLYNKRTPRFLSKLTKKMGGKVGTTKIRTGNEPVGSGQFAVFRGEEMVAGPYASSTEAREWRRNEGATAGEGYSVRELPAEGQGTEVWTLPITDEMRAAVPQGLPLFQTGDSPRGFIEFTKARDIFTITLTGNANLSTYLHESGHYFLELMTDLVESGQASVRMAEDLQKLREWAGVGPDGKFQVEHHEKFARAFEAYLMEGNAPSRDLRGIFNKFKGWLTFIYKSLTNLNVELTDEVRGVMDRMLATDEEIAKAKRQSGRSEQPEAQENLGMTDQEYEQYIRLWEASQEAEKTRVDMRKMKDFLVAQREAFKDEVARVTRQMREQIEETQAYQTWDDLRNRQVKIDRDSIPAELRDLAFGMWSKDGSGLPLDVMAESKGYQNGKEMLTDIAAMRARLEAIPEMANKSVEEAHGFVTDAEIEKVSQQAIQQKEHEELMLMEYMSLTARDGKRARKGFMEWMHQTAANRVSLMTDRELRPDHWRRAELKAAQKVGAAIARGDTTTAALAKRQQIMAYTMHKATLEAVDGIAKIRNDMMKFSKKSRQATLGKAGEVFQNGVNALLEQVSFRAATLRSIDAAKAVQKMMDEFGPNSIAQIPDDVAALLGKTHYRDMTYGELVALHETVTTIYRQARDQNKLKAAERELSFQEWLKEVRDRAMANMGAVPQSARSGRNLKENAVEGLRYIRAQMMKQEFLTAMFDGSISGGPAKEILFDPIADAEAAEWELKKKIYKPIIDRFRSMSKEQRRRLNEKVDFMGNGWNMGKQGTRMNVLMAAMNMGNASSMDKLLGGYGWDEQRLRNEVNSLLSKEDFDLMQDILDTVNKLWPDVERESFKATGIKPEKIEAMAIETPYGTYAGGYFPVAYDLGHIDNRISQSKITEDGTFVNNFFSAKVQDGMTKKRTGVVSPVRLEPDVLTNHLRETIHYITHFEAVSQIDRVLRRPEFRKLVFEVAGEEFYKEMRRWLKDVAQGAYVSDSSMQLGERWFHHLRTGTSLAFLGFGIGTMAKQQLGLFTSLRAVKPMYWAAGIARVYNPITGPGVIRRAFRESTELQRLIDEWDRDFGKEIDRIGSKLDSTLWDKIRVYAMRGIALSQALVNVATYVAAKDQRLSAGDTPAEAKRFAEAAIRTTQSAAGMKDMSPVQRANEITKMMTPFFSFASVFYNQLEKIKQEHKSFKDTPKTFGKLMVMVIAPAVATVLIDELISSMSDEEDDDDKTLAQKMALETLSYSLMGLPVIRDIMSFAYRPSISPYGQVYEQFQATPRAAAELMTEGEIRRSTAKQAVTGISVLTKVPMHQPYGYFDDFFGEAIFEK